MVAKTKISETEINKGLIHEIYNLCFSYRQENKLAKMICARIDDTKPEKQKEREEQERLLDQQLPKWASRRPNPLKKEWL